MNTRQLRFFLQIAEVGSVSRAASFLHIVQPALSRQIRGLEQELGVTLFQRSGKGVALTDAGRLLRERAVALLRHFERVHHEVRDGFNDPSGELSVAMPTSMLELVTIPAMAKYRTAYPNVQLRIYEGVSGVLNAWAMVQQGLIDLAVVTSIEPLATLESSAFAREPLCLVGLPQTGLQLDQPVSLGDVAARPLVVPSRPNTMRLILETAMAQHKLPLDVVLEANTPHLVLGAVRAGQGFGALPYCSAMDAYERGLVALAPITGVAVEWSLIQARDQPLSTAGERMKALLRHCAYEQIASGGWRLAQPLA